MSFNFKSDKTNLLLHVTLYEYKNNCRRNWHFIPLLKYFYCREVNPDTQNLTGVFQHCLHTYIHTQVLMGEHLKGIN